MTAFSEVYRTIPGILMLLAAMLLVRVTETELLILADAEQPPPIPELPLPFTCTAEDGQLTVRVQIGGDAS